MRPAVLLNLAAYQCAWLACVLGAAAQRPEIGIAAVLVVLLWHLRSAQAPWRELQLIGIAMLIGAAFESALVVSGLVRLPGSSLLGGVLPLWMVALWAAFATTLNVSLRALRAHRATSAVLAAIGAPLAYYGGARLGALELVQILPALLSIAAGWALVTPLLMRSAERHDGFAAP